MREAKRIQGVVIDDSSTTAFISDSILRASMRCIHVAVRCGWALVNVKVVTVFASFLLLLALFSCPVSVVMADSGAGSFTLVVSGYAINGSLQNVVVDPDGSISMNMVLDAALSTSIGSIPMTANGVWVGIRNGSMVSGAIQNVAGSANPCFLFWCGTATFVGQGQWSGSLASNSTLGSGGFQGTITFTSSDFSQIPVGQPQPISGTWNADFT
jgi:hypothetical protein